MAPDQPRGVSTISGAAAVGRAFFGFLFPFPQIQQADIIHLHWIADGMASINTLKQLNALQKNLKLFEDESYRVKKEINKKS